jgi:aminodeoxyfutalosine deaminase
LAVTEPETRNAKSETSLMLLRAKTVLPISAPPISDGAVLVFGERIQNVGRWKDVRRECVGEVIDLGDAILLPGLINAHCHLDYTDMAGRLSPAKDFSDWIQTIVGLKAEWSYTDFALSWIKGAKMLVQSGTTTVVDIEAVPELLPDVTTTTALRVISCFELLSVRKQRNARRIVEAAVEQLVSMAPQWAGLSPHAPYSTSPELLRAASRVAREHGWLLTTHVAESSNEFEMYKRRRGAMYRWLKSQRDMTDCDGCSPVAHLARNDVLWPNFLGVHANYLAPGDAELLARSGASVVHCPRSHQFFGHKPFSLAELQAAGVNICLGTDSMATMSKSRGEPWALNLFSEMRAMAKVFPELGPQRLLELTTVAAAKAIGQAGQLGCLASGAIADVIAVPAGSRDPFEAALDHRGDVSASMIGGRWAIAPNT